MRHPLAGILAGLTLAAPVPAAETAAGTGDPRTVAISNAAWKGDLDGMIGRRMIRVAVPYSRSLYYLEGGRERGVTAELAREFERWFNARERKRLGGRPVSVVLIPTTRDRLLSSLTEGRADIAGGNITATASRRQIARFVILGSTPRMNEIIVTGPGAPPLRGIDDLAGKTVHVRPATSYYENLQRLNARFRALRRPPMKLAALPDALEDEDKLEMVNVGLLQIVVVDDWLGRVWAQQLPDITLRTDLVLRAGGQSGWAVRPDDAQLAALLEEFNRTQIRAKSLVPVLRGQLQRSLRALENNTAGVEIRRFQQSIGLFRKYGGEYQMDPLLLAAQGYQESRLRQETRSAAGAIGVMQVMPATGRSMRVGDIRRLEPNIHAGTKYMDNLMTDYFQDAHFDEQNRTLFAFASYNAGPGNIARMRRLAAERGLDPDVWFNNVELVTAEKIGVETTTYVRNILKYYVSYRLIEESRREVDAARQSVPRTAPAAAPAEPAAR